MSLIPPYAAGYLVDMRLDEIRPVYGRSGPFVTLHLDVSRSTEDARQQIDARWTRARHELERQGVGPGLLAELEERLHEVTHVHGDVRRTIVAAEEQVVLDQVLAGRPAWEETVGVAPLPDLAGWALQRDGLQSFLLVELDREGADLSVCTGPGVPAQEREQVHGDDFDITKVAPGDWAQKQYQQRAENTWEANAKLVAERAAQVCGRVGLDLVVLAGDVRMRSLVQRLLGERRGIESVQIESGGRAAGVSEEAMWSQVQRVLAAFDAREKEDLAVRLAAHSPTVAHGLDAVLDAFVRGEVDELAVDLEAARGLRVDPRRHDGLELPAAAAAAGDLPADQVLLAAAARTDARATVLPRDLVNGAGVAAALRW